MGKKHKMWLDEDTDRSLMINSELSTDKNYSVEVVFKKSPSGNKINYLIIRSTTSPKAFEDTEIPADGIKIPPDVPEFKKVTL